MFSPEAHNYSRAATLETIMTQARAKAKKCLKCGKTKPRGQFHKHARSRDGLQGWCKRCMCGARNRLYYERHPTASNQDGRSFHPLYSRWIGMRQRCRDSHHSAYKQYGGRGIKVDPVFDDFNVYAAHIMSLPHALELGRTIDRKDNDGDYTPGNLRWATRKEQIANRRRAATPAPSRQTAQVC